MLPRSRAALVSLGLLAILAAGSGRAGAQEAAAAVSAEQIRHLAEQSALEQLQDSELARGARRVSVEAGSLDSRLQLAACAVPIRVEVDLSRPNGRINARLSCGAPSPWSLYVPLQLSVFHEVVIATRPLGRGEAIGTDDVTLAERDVLAVTSPPLMRLEDAIGHQLRRNVGANAALAVNAVEMPLLIRRGERISLSSRSGGIVVTTGAEALGDGRDGQKIRVRNLQSSRVVDATVTGPGRAEVI